MAVENQTRTLLDLPDLPGNYELKSAFLTFVVPEDSINFFQNPSGEIPAGSSYIPGFASKDTLTAVNASTNPAQAPAYGLYAIGITPQDTIYSGELVVPLPDGYSDFRLASGNNSQSTVSCFLTGKYGEGAVVSVELPHVYDSFNRTGTFHNSYDDLQSVFNRWSSASGNYSIVSNKLQIASTAVNSVAYIAHNAGGVSLAGTYSVDITGTFVNGLSYTGPTLMIRYDQSTQKFIGVRLTWNTVALITGVANTTPTGDTTLSSASFAFVTGTTYRLRVDVTKTGSNTTFNVYINNFLQFSYTTNDGFLSPTYYVSNMGFTLVTAGAPGGNVTFDNFYYLDTSSAIASKSITFTTEWQRVSLTFPYVPFTFFKQVLFIRKNTKSLNPFFADGFSYENKAYATTYFDGDFGGTWEGLPNSSTSIRDQSDGGGQVVSFNSLDIKVTGFAGFGMTPVSNKTTVQGQSGNESYDRTTTPKATRSIVCCMYGNDLEDLMRKRKRLQNTIGPDVLTNTAKNIKVQFQLVNPYTGEAKGRVFETFVKYIGGLEGNISNDWKDTFVLQLESYQTPGIFETRPSSFIFPNTGTTNTPDTGFWYKANNQWKIQSNGTNPVSDVYIDRQGAYWAGINNIILRLNVPPYQNNYYTAGQGLNLIGGTATALDFLMTPNQRMYFAGSFTSPANYIFYQDINGVATPVGPNTWNAQINALDALNNGKVLIGGIFTVPGNYLALYDPALNTSTVFGSLAGGGVFDFAVVPSGAGFYVCGNFTTSGATTVNRIFYYNLRTGVISALSTASGTGFNAVCRCMALGPDNKLYCGGDFTTAGGASTANITCWNGSNFVQVGDGLNGPVYGLKFGPDGMLYAVGQFSATSNGRPLTPGIAKFNGTVWLPVDIDFSGATGLTVQAIDLDAKSTIFGVSAQGANVIYPAQNYNVNYSGAAGVQPKIVFDNTTGVATVNIFQISNFTTGKTLYFNYSITPGEYATLQFTKIGVQFVSSFGNNNTSLLPGSDSESFGLTPGNNQISITLGPQTANFRAYMTWVNQHYSFDGSVNNVGNL